jgi:hypothetical protein
LNPALHWVAILVQSVGMRLLPFVLSVGCAGRAMRACFGDCLQDPAMSNSTAQRRHALITGSTSGIGLAIARACAGAGMHVTLNGFGEPDAIEATRAMVQDAIATLGSVDILVNNAGIQFVSPVEDFPPEKWEQIVAINLSSAPFTPPRPPFPA